MASGHTPRLVDGLHASLHGLLISCSPFVLSYRRGLSERASHFPAIFYLSRFSLCVQQLLQNAQNGGGITGLSKFPFLLLCEGNIFLCLTFFFFMSPSKGLSFLLQMAKCGTRRLFSRDAETLLLSSVCVRGRRR